MTTQQRIERIADEHMGRPLTESDAVAHQSCIAALTAFAEETEKPEDHELINSFHKHNRMSRCGICYWALYDGMYCQNPNCAEYTKPAENRIYLTNREAAKLLGCQVLKQATEPLPPAPSTGEKPE